MMGPADVGKFIALGLAAGVLGGMFGIGGGLIMVPALVLLFGFGLKEATGTSLLAQLLPVGILGVLEYWRRAEVRGYAGLSIAIGLLFGAYLGARLTGLLPAADVKRAYGVFLVLVGLYFCFSSPAKLAARAKASAPPAAAPAHVQRPPDLS